MDNPLKIDLSRQQDIVPDASTFKAIILGVGTAGSNAAHILAKMGIGELEVWDPQYTELENVAPGYFTLKDVKKTRPKVDALTRRFAKELGIKNIIPVHRPYMGEDELAADLVYFAPDSMDIRGIFWDAIKRGVIDCRVMVDTRMGKDVVEFYIIDTADEAQCKWYETTLGVTVDDTPCGEKATAFITGGVIPYILGSVVRNMLIGYPLPVHVFTKAGPFFYSMDWQVPNVSSAGDSALKA